MPFLHYYAHPEINYNIVLAASAEEEISGTNGIELLLPYLGKIDCGIVGEPTGLEMAVAERGLMVIDCIARGTAGHAARGAALVLRESVRETPNTVPIRSLVKGRNHGRASLAANTSLRPTAGRRPSLT